MRILVDLAEAEIRALDDLSREEKRSRAALIREAVDELLTRRRNEQAKDAFGLWGSRRVDGLAYQDQVRSEW